MNLWQDTIENGVNSLFIRRTRYPKIQGSNTQLITVNRSYLNFVSNDYLGLSQNEEIKEAMITAIQKYGIGSTGAATLSGFHQEEIQFRDNLAKWLGFPSALTFSSGYQLSLGIYKQLVDMLGKKGNNLAIKVWLDKKCHASHIDGLLLAKAKLTTFAAESIDEVIAKIKTEDDRLHIILTEGVFSMDGACTYLDKIIALKKENHSGNIMLIVDDAHGIGTLGENGRGFCSNFDMEEIDLLIGTLGKAFATHGGFICGNNVLIDYLEQTVRSHIYTTCLPPAIFAASNKSLSIIRSVVGDNLRQKLFENIKNFLSLAKKYNLPVYNLGHNLSPIQLLMFDNQELVKKIYARLLAANIMIGRMLYPTVSINAPRLRISITAEHKHEHLLLLCESISNVLGVV